MKICGSYRRKLDTCGDMDILLTGVRPLEPKLNTIVTRLQRWGVLQETLCLGKTKYMGITHISDGTAFRIDMEIVQPSEWPFALLYFTGSGTFNERQRTIAKQQGYSLSEHGLMEVATGEYVKRINLGGKNVRLLSEKQIFEFLGMEYILPEDRK